MRGQCSWGRLTTVCTKWVLISGPRYSLSSHHPLWPQLYLDLSFTIWLDSTIRNGTNSQYSVSTFYLFYSPFLIVLTLFLIYNASSGYALILGTIFSDKQLAVTLTPVLIIPFMLFAGFFVNQDNIPKWLIEFQYLSIFKYGYQALMLNEYEGLTLECMELG